MKTFCADRTVCRYEQLLVTYAARLQQHLPGGPENPSGEGESMPSCRPLIEAVIEALQPGVRNTALSTSSSLARHLAYYLDLLQTTFAHAKDLLFSAAEQRRFLLLLGELHELSGEIDQAMTTYEDIIAQSDSGSINLRGTVELRLGQLLAGHGDWPAAEHYLGKARKTLEQAGNQPRRLTAEIELAKISYRKGEYRQAEQRFRQALESYADTTDLYHRAVIINHLGVIARLQGDRARASTNFQEAMVCFQRTHDAIGEAESWNNLGRVYFEQKNFREALNCYDKAWETLQESHAQALKAFIHLNKAELYLEIQDMPLTIMNCRRALEISSRNKNALGMARALRVAAQIAWKTGTRELAEICFEASIAFYREYRIPLGLACALTAYASFLESQKETQKARQYRREAKKINRVLEMQKQVMRTNLDGLHGYVRGDHDADDQPSAEVPHSEKIPIDSRKQ